MKYYTATHGDCRNGCRLVVAAVHKWTSPASLSPLLFASPRTTSPQSNCSIFWENHSEMDSRRPPPGMYSNFSNLAWDGWEFLYSFLSFVGKLLFPDTSYKHLELTMINLWYLLTIFPFTLGAPPPYAFVNRIYTRSLRPVVIASGWTRSGARIWQLITRVHSWRAKCSMDSPLVRLNYSNRWSLAKSYHYRAVCTYSS